MIESNQIRRVSGPFVGVLVFAAAFGLAASADAQTPYSFTKLKYPGSTFTYAAGINNAKQIVGTYRDAAGVLHGYLYNGTSYVTVDYPGSQAGGNYALGITETGQVLGTYAYSANGPWHAYIMDKGVFTSFDYPGNETDVRGSASNGELVGVFNAGGVTAPHSFVKSGTMFTRLDVPNAWGTEAWDKNDNGIVSGYYYDSAFAVRGFTYAGGVYQTMDFPGATQTWLTRLDNRNQAVGWQVQAGRAHGFLWSGASYRTFDVDGSTSTQAAGINDNGIIVGQYSSADCPAGCGFIATPRTGAPVCSQSLALTYANNTLTLRFTLNTAVPTIWSVYLNINGSWLTMWSESIPTINPSTVLSAPFAGVPPLGAVTGMSALSTASGVMCADLATVNTGP